MNTAIEGVILAGGESKRMGTNKSLIELHNKPLIEHVYDRLIDQVSHVSINTNQPIQIFPKKIQFDDRILNKTGPLAGIQAGLFYAKKNWVQFCPNDCPFLPINLVEKLSFCIKDKGPTIILPSLFDRLEPVFMLCHRFFSIRLLHKFCFIAFGWWFWVVGVRGYAIGLGSWKYTT